MNYCEIIDKSAQDMQRDYYEKELWYDTHKEFNGMCMDNVSGTFGTYDLEYWLFNGDRELYTNELHRLYMFYGSISWMCECKGYGCNAAARGFDVTHSWGILWTRCERAISAIRSLCDKFNVNCDSWFMEAVADARKRM